MSQDILKKLSELLNCIDTKTTADYKQTMPQSVEYVNKRMKERSDVKVLTGSLSFGVVEQNHQNHAEFMHSIFVTKDAQSMYKTYIWAYKHYHSKGFLFDYFYHELFYWKSFFQTIENDSLDSIVNLYDYVLSLHEHFVTQANNEQDTELNILDHTVYNNFLDAILHFNLDKALQISNDFIKKDEDIKVFWQQIILPALYSVGSKWENAEISVGEEHTATSICKRVMSEHYDKILNHVTNKGYVLVTTSPKELHDIGARMLADILELNGYNVSYLGSQSTQEKIFDAIRENKIKFVIVSTAIISNVIDTKEFVAAIRGTFKEPPIKIIVGGQAYIQNPSAFNSIDADYCISDSNSLLELLESEN